MRYCRYRLMLTQKQVAERVGISKNKYFNLENGQCNCYDIKTMDKLAKLFGVSVYDLLDDYNWFLAQGQGNAIKKIRKSLNLSAKEFAAFLKIDCRKLQQWETEQNQVSLKSFNRYFKNCIKKSP